MFFVMLVAFCALIATAVNGDNFANGDIVTLQNKGNKKYFGYDIDRNAEERAVPHFFKAILSGSYWQFQPYFQSVGHGTLLSGSKRIKSKKSGSKFRTSLEDGTGDQVKWTRQGTGSLWRFKSKEHTSHCMRSTYIGSGNGYGAPLGCGTNTHTHWDVQVHPYTSSSPITGNLQGCTFASGDMVTFWSVYRNDYIGYQKSAASIIYPSYPYPFLVGTSNSKFTFKPWFDTASSSALLSSNEFLSMSYFDPNGWRTVLHVPDVGGTGDEWTREMTSNGNHCQFRNSLYPDHCMMDNAFRTQHCDLSVNKNLWIVTKVPIAASNPYSGGVSDAFPLLNLPASDAEYFKGPRPITAPMPQSQEQEWWLSSVLGNEPMSLWLSMACAAFVVTNLCLWVFIGMKICNTRKAGGKAVTQHEYASARAEEAL